MKLRILFGSLIIVLASAFLPIALFELYSFVFTHKNNDFVTNLSDNELNEQEIKRVGNVDIDYYNRVALMPWHTPKTEWQWPGQKDRKVEFFIKGKWNNYGCNDIDFEESGDAQLFIGDSFVESLQVPSDKTFYKLYRDRVGGKLKIYACGYSGWSPREIYENLLAITKNHVSLSRLKVKHVHLFTYIGNDLTDTYRQKIFMSKAKCHSDSNFFTARLLQIFIRKYITNELLECIEPMLFAYDLQNEHLIPAIQEYAKYLIEIKKILSKKDINLTVYIIPPLALYQTNKLNILEQSLMKNTAYVQYISSLDKHYCEQYSWN